MKIITMKQKTPNGYEEIYPIGESAIKAKLVFNAAYAGASFSIKKDETTVASGTVPNESPYVAYAFIRGLNTTYNILLSDSVVTSFTVGPIYEEMVIYIGQSNNSNTGIVNLKYKSDLIGAKIQCISNNQTVNETYLKDETEVSGYKTKTLYLPAGNYFIKTKLFTREFYAMDNSSTTIVVSNGDTVSPIIEGLGGAIRAIQYGQSLPTNLTNYKTGDIFLIVGE